MKNFIHLHTHSHYSLLDGLSKIDNLVRIAKENKMPALALTDHGNLYGAIEFYKTCKEAKIKPIIGVEVYVAARSRFDKNPNLDNRRSHLTLLAKNLTGYQNLIKLVTRSHLEGFYYKPRVDKELLREHHEGLICLSGCMGGELGRALAGNDSVRAEEIIREHQDIFGSENYFLEAMNHPGVKNDREVRAGVSVFSKKLGIPIVGTQDSHYPTSDDKRAHETLLAVQTGSDMRDEDKFTFGSDDFSLIDNTQAMEYFKEIPEALENTFMVAERCELELPLGRWVFPNFPLPPGSTSNDELRRLIKEGLARLKIPETDEFKKRLNYELEVIEKKGYAPYFLVVADLIRFARSAGILTNIRGSVAGSLATYLLGITAINPLEYNLPFERFLNIERPTPPDIDMDFADNRRDEVLEYTKKKYGEECVAQIGTFGTMMARGGVRDVARALGYPYLTGDRISRLIPLGSQGFPMTIDRALETVPELAEAYKREKDTKEIINLAKKMEGCARHISVHAAGVVIAPRPLSEFVPLQFDPKGGKIITQYDMHAVEDAGLLKFDFLGIRNLSILADSIKLVKKLHGRDIDIEKIPLDDKKTFEMLARGETMGVFQMGGSGMTRCLKNLKPSSIHDINAMVALYRPGPIELIPEYIKRKHNPALIKYLDPRMEEILNHSYGVITYQDDVLIIAVKIAGYSWTEADKLRKAMGKKIPKEMAAQKEKFIAGCVDHGLNPGRALELWKLIEPFAAYGFNKAHAACYGRLAYQTAYMKASFPVEYMASIMTNEAGDVDKIAEVINECVRMKIKVLPPSINESFGGFTVIGNTNDTIRFGLYSIKNLGADIADAFITERKNGGAYESLESLLARVRHKNLNKKSLEALIQSGSLDELGERGQMMANSEKMLGFAREAGQADSAQSSLFGAGTISNKLRLEKSAPASQSEKLAWEKELLGLYISGHPLDKFKNKLARSGLNIKKIKDELLDGTKIGIAVLVEDVRPVTTKNGEQMAFLRLADLSGNIEAVVFPKLFQLKRDILAQEKCLAVEGRVSLRRGEKSLIIETVREI